MGKRDCLEIVSHNRATVHCTGSIEGLGGDGGSLSGHSDGFATGYRFQGHGKVSNKTYDDLYIARCFGETLGGYGDVIRPRQQALDAELSTVVSEGLTP